MNKLRWAAIDGWTMSLRSFKHIFREAESLVMAVGLPVAIMVMFVYVFGGAIQTGTDYVNYVVPGVIITCIGFGSSLIAVSVTQDMVGGLFERLRTMSVFPASLLVGHVIGGCVRNTAATTAAVLAALLIGFRPSAGVPEWFAAMGLLVLFMMAVSWMFVVFGLLVKSVEAANAFTFPMLFLPYLSSAFVPTETMPSWLYHFAEVQPMTPLIEALRGLLLGLPVGNSYWTAVVWFGSILIVSVTASHLMFKHRARS